MQIYINMHTHICIYIYKNKTFSIYFEIFSFFRIRRGTDECAVESIAVEAFPIP